MNTQRRAIFLSLLLHALIITTVLAAGYYLPIKEPLINFYFDIVTPSPTVAAKTAPVNAVPQKRKKESQPLSQAMPQSEPVRQETTPDREIAPPITTPAINADNSGKAGAEVNFPSPVNIAKVDGALPGSGRSGPVGAVSGDGKGGGEALSANAGNTRYLREHFNYIKDSIMRNVRYPEAARRMSWEGKVVVSFVVKRDGSVTDVKVNQSSGFSVLDKNACDTVINTAPFPRPPIPAQLIIPLVYRLN